MISQYINEAFIPRVQYKQNKAFLLSQQSNTQYHHRWKSSHSLLFAMSLTHYQMTNFMLFQTKKVCRRQFKFDENGRKLSIWVENTAGKRKFPL